MYQTAGIILVVAVIAAGCADSDVRSGKAGDVDAGLFGPGGAGIGGGAAGTDVSAAGTSGGSAGTGSTSGDASLNDAAAQGGDGSTDGALADASETGDASAAADAGPDADTGSDAAIDSGFDAGPIDPNWPPPPATTELAALPSSWATAVCDALASCVKPSYYESVFDGAACEARLLPQLADGDFVYLQASIDAGRIAFDPSALAACYTDLAGLACNVLSSRSPVSCNLAVQGQVPSGQACVIDSDCGASLFCDRSAACPGVCAALRGEGGACDRPDQCESGKLCREQTCRAPAQNGAKCDFAGNPPCALGLICTGADRDTDTAGTCVDQDTAFAHDVGAACDPGAGLWCKDGLACVVGLKSGAIDPADLEVVCKARVAAGAACAFSFAPEQCPEAEYCPADLNPNYESTCAARPGEGEDCGVFNMCAQGLRCRSSDGKCHALSRIGQVCAAGTECASGRCKAKLCAAPSRCRLDAVGPSCGDDSCDPDETCEDCPEDCGDCPAVCGDTECEAPETCDSCQSDCGECPAVCGDTECDATETCIGCADDCGACPAPYSGPCDTDAECGAGKVCAQSTVDAFPLPTVNYSYCAETCASSTACTGNATQRQCNAGKCALRCNAVLGILDPTYRCPLDMQCESEICTRLN